MGKRIKITPQNEATLIKNNYQIPQMVNLHTIQNTNIDSITQSNRAGFSDVENSTKYNTNVF